MNCLAHGPGILASGSDDGTVRTWCSITLQPLLCLRGHGQPVHSVALDPAGRYLASGSAGKTIRLWDLLEGTCARVIQGHRGSIRSLCWATPRSLVSGSGDQSLILWSVLRDRDGVITAVDSELSIAGPFRGSVAAIVFVPADAIVDEPCILVASLDGTVTLFSVLDGDISTYLLID